MPGNLGMKAELEMNTMAGLDSLSKQEFSLAFMLCFSTSAWENTSRKFSLNASS